MTLRTAALAGITVVAVASLAILAACDDEGTITAIDGTPSDRPTGPPPTVSTPLPTARPFIGGRDRIEETPRPGQAGPSTLSQVKAYERPAYDHIEFNFNGGVPSFSVEYVDAALSCGSGLPVEVAGSAFLEIRMSPTAAHDESGVETIAKPDMLFNFPTLRQLTMTCDFEGEVVWVAGLSEEVDFRAATEEAPERIRSLVILVYHPESS